MCRCIKGGRLETVKANDLQKVISPKELKEYLKCADKTLYNLLSRRDFPSFKIGKKYYIIYDDFLKWMDKESKKNK